MKFLYDVVTKHHKKMMMWGDIALQYKEIPEMLPRDIIYLTWEYSDQQSYARWIQPFADRKLEFMVCPGILNSYRLFPDMVMAKGNIAGFLAAGKQQGATGAFTTIWMMAVPIFSRPTGMGYMQLLKRAGISTPSRMVLLTTGMRSMLTERATGVM